LGGGEARRSDQNMLKRMTLKIVETLRICNERFNYQPIIMNPKRDLTQPSEGVLNNGYDNADNDYILRVSDLIITPEGRE
jgi:dual specificity protein kinase YAK1